MQREAYFDNARLFLIFFVVFGHLIQPLTSEVAYINTIYHWVYTFHMPAFIFISGFFAKGYGNKGYVLNLVKKLIYPYLLFQFIYTIYYFFIGKEDWFATPFYPHWSLWFLFSLFCWHIMLYWFKKLPPIIGILIALELGLVVGYMNGVGHTFSLSRTFVFFPFFLVGYWLTKEQLFKFKLKPVKIAALLTMTALAVVIAITPDFSTDWLLGSKSYATVGAPELGGLFRLMVYGVAAVMTVSVLAWVPMKQNIFTNIGQKTLYIYLLHGFFIQFFREANMFHINTAVDLIGLVVIAFGIVLLLSSKVMQGMWQPFIEGKASLIKKTFSHPKNDY